ncbi:MAG: hypothetical protein K0R67_2953 [Paenibacillus sp.]|jgi:uncharacterized membrane protein|nr:hypothetical protein [Paenibacillus sp.]
MNTSLAIFASIVGLFVTIVALYTAWYVYQDRKSGENDQGTDEAQKEKAPMERSRSLLQRWMIWDWTVLILFGCGAVFLLVDIVAISKVVDQYQFPPYHYGYMLSGFIFCVLGMLFSTIRVISLLWLAGRSRTAGANNANEPYHTDHAENGV